MKNVTLTVNHDTSSIGTDASPEDLDRFAENLQTGIEEKFGVNCHLVRRSCERSVDCDDPEIRRWLHQIMQSDGWQSYL